MINNISLTIRIPHQMNTKLLSLSKEIGITKTNLIRSSIHDFLTDNSTILNFDLLNNDKKDRIVLNVNQLTYDILTETCEKYNQSMNSVVIAVIYLALERSSKWLQSIQK